MICMWACYLNKLVKGGIKCLVVSNRKNWVDQNASASESLNETTELDKQGFFCLMSESIDMMWHDVS
jgi:hypothetical protein